MRKLLLLTALVIHLMNYGENNREQREATVTLTDKQFQQLLDKIVAQKQSGEPIISKSQVAKIMGVGVGVTALGYGIHTYKKELMCVAALVAGAPYVARIGDMIVQAGPHIASAFTALKTLLSSGHTAASSSVADAAVNGVLSPVASTTIEKVAETAAKVGADVAPVIMSKITGTKIAQFAAPFKPRLARL